MDIDGYGGKLYEKVLSRESTSANQRRKESLKNIRHVKKRRERNERKEEEKFLRISFDPFLHSRFNLHP